jgi:formylglycine-generating enzyme required for sulfatase activity
MQFGKLCECERTGTKPVGSYPPGVSSHGIHDMAGNVMECRSDFYSSTYYSNSPGNNPTGTSSGADHGVRGGSWHSYPGVIRTTHRIHLPSGESGFTLVFRFAKD